MNVMRFYTLYSCPMASLLKILKKGSSFMSFQFDFGNSFVTAS